MNAPIEDTRNWTAGTEDECQCASSLCQFRIAAARERVSEALWRASEKDWHDDRNRFIPRGKIMKLFDADNVSSLLRVFLEQELESSSTGNEATLQDIAAFVSPDDGHCRCANAFCTGARTIFATLILMAKEDQIRAFYRAYPNPEAKLCDTKGDPSSLIKDWLPSEKEVFRQRQWWMKSPFFQKFEPSKQLAQELGEELTLPWTDVAHAELKLDSRTGSNSLKPQIRGEFGVVWKIRIHPDHHNMGNPDGHFALKATEKTIRQDLGDMIFKREVDASKNIGQPHERIVPLLQAFKYKGNAYLVFQWAEGGSLKDLWRTPSQPGDAGGAAPPALLPSWFSRDWFWRQCLGLADGLAYMQGFPALESGQNCAVPQLHADIKPANVLAFSVAEEGGGGPYELKLADFGMSCTVDAEGRVKTTKKDLQTYMPPEKELGRPFVSLKWDIWCLGCLYLEFITWILLGPSGILDFRKERLAEMNHWTIRGQGILSGSDKFFRKKAASPVLSLVPGVLTKPAAKVKKSVLKKIEQLKSHKRCDDKIRSFLEYIESSMLVIDETRRDTAKGVRNFLATHANAANSFAE